MDRRDWNPRHAASDLVWGADPNRCGVAELAGETRRGRALDPVCDEHVDVERVRSDLRRSSGCAGADVA